MMEKWESDCDNYILNQALARYEECEPEDEYKVFCEDCYESI